MNAPSFAPWLPRQSAHGEPNPSATIRHRIRRGLPDHAGLDPAFPEIPRGECHGGLPLLNMRNALALASLG